MCQVGINQHGNLKKKACLIWTGQRLTLPDDYMRIWFQATLYDVDCLYYLVCNILWLLWNHQDLIVYRPIWLTFSCNEECDSHDLPAKAKRFDSFFKQLTEFHLHPATSTFIRDSGNPVELRRFDAFCREVRKMMNCFFI